MKYANVTKGYGVKYWEIGDEIPGNGEYGAQWEYDKHTSHSATTYATNLLRFISAMKAVDPTVKIGAVLVPPGTWPDGIVGPGETQDWNDTVMSIAGSKIDFVIDHIYPSPTSEADLLTEPQTLDPPIMSATRSLINKYAGANAPNVGIAVTETNGSKYSDTAPQGMVSSGASCEPALNTPFPSYYGTEMISKLGSPGDTLVSASSSTSLVSAHAVKRANGDVDVMLINKDPNNDASISLSYNGFTPGTGTPTVYSYLKNGHSITSAATGSAGNQTVPACPVVVVQLHPSGGGSAGGSPGNCTPSGRRRQVPGRQRRQHHGRNPDADLRLPRRRQPDLDTHRVEPADRLQRQHPDVPGRERWRNR